MFDFDTESGAIRAYGSIGPYEDGIDEGHFMEAFDAMGGRDIHITVKSPGGSVDSGQSIYNQIENYPGKSTVHVDASAYSIASYFPMAADKVTIAENSLMMVHDPWAVAMGNSKDFRGVAELLDVMAAVIADGYAKKTGRDAAYWRGIMGQDTYFTAQEALDVGLVDEIAGKAKATPRKAAAAAVSPAFAAKQIAAKLRLRMR